MALATARRLQNAATATGNGDAITTTGFGTVAFDVAISVTATVTFEAMGQSGTYVSLPVINVATGAVATTTTATGLFRANVSALEKVRARISAYTGGTITVNATASEPELSGALGASGAIVDTELPAAAALADAATVPTTPKVGAVSMLYNGSTVDLERGTHEITVFASAARTATPADTDLTNYNARGVAVVIDCTAITATPSVVFTIEGKDSLSGKYYTILASAAITAAGTTLLRVYPGLTAAANTVASSVLPRVWRVTAVHADADSITYSVGAALIP